MKGGSSFPGEGVAADYFLFLMNIKLKLCYLTCIFSEIDNTLQKCYFFKKNSKEALGILMSEKTFSTWNRNYRAPFSLLEPN